MENKKIIWEERKLISKNSLEKLKKIENRLTWINNNFTLNSLKLELQSFYNFYSFLLVIKFYKINS